MEVRLETALSVSLAWGAESSRLGRTLGVREGREGGRSLELGVVARWEGPIRPDSLGLGGARPEEALRPRKLDVGTELGWFLIPDTLEVGACRSPWECRLAESSLRGAGAELEVRELGSVAKKEALSPGSWEGMARDWARGEDSPESPKSTDVTQCRAGSPGQNWLLVASHSGPQCNHCRDDSECTAGLNTHMAWAALAWNVGVRLPSLLGAIARGSGEDI